MAEIEWKKELKSRCDIVNVVSSYVTLVKRGKNFWGRCPFHSERTPSFTVSPEIQYYKCFGCGAGGDVITFVMEVENLPFMDACKFLAKRCGYKLPEIDADSPEAKEARRKERLFHLTDEINSHYERNLRLPEGKEALNYLYGRGLTDEVITRFRIGYCLDGSESIKYANSKGYSVQEMADCGMLAESERKNDRFGGFYDMMYGRITIPIINQFGNVVAFGGRFVGKTDFAKYKNTANQSVIFTKGNTLYGINLISALRKQKQLNDGIIVVEGYMDVIGLCRFGINNVVATMGTAMTEAQARQISQYTDKVYLCYDGDSAGQHAADRGSLILYNKGLNVKVITLKDNLDPDEYVGKYGKEAFENEIANAKPLFVYIISKLSKNYDLSTFEGRGAFASAALNELKIIENPLAATPYLEMIADYSQHSVEELHEVFMGKVSQEKLYAEKKTVAENKETLYEKCLFFVLSATLSAKPYVSKTDDLTTYIDAKYTDFYKLAYSALTEGKVLSPAEYHDYIIEDDAAKLMRGYEPNGFAVTDEASYYKDCVRTIKEISIKQKWTAVAKALQSETDEANKKKLNDELMALTQLKRKLMR